MYKYSYLAFVSTSYFKIFFPKEFPISEKMKYLAVLIVAVVAVGSISCEPHSGIHDPAPKPIYSAPKSSSSKGLGSILQPVISDIVHIIVQYVINVLEQSVPEGCEVNVLTLVKKVLALKNPTVESVVNTSLALFKVNSAPILNGIKPNILIKVPVNIITLEIILKKNIPPKTKNVKYADLAKIFDDYFVDLYTNLAVTLLNLIH